MLSHSKYVFLYQFVHCYVKFDSENVNCENWNLGLYNLSDSDSMDPKFYDSDSNFRDQKFSRLRDSNFVIPTPTPQHWYQRNSHFVMASLTISEDSKSIFSVRTCSIWPGLWSRKNFGSLESESELKNLGSLESVGKIIQAKFSIITIYTFWIKFNLAVSKLIKESMYWVK